MPGASPTLSRRAPKSRSNGGWARHRTDRCGIGETPPGRCRAPRLPSRGGRRRAAATADGVGIEQIGAVLARPRQLLAAIEDVELQVELGRASGQLDRAEKEAGQGQGRDPEVVQVDL